jgi:hypothetical protein
MQTEQKRIVIVGAGASGLALAHGLRERGIDGVVVLEQAPAVGGKCATLQYEGRTYELGAAIVTPAYRNVQRLMREFGVTSSFRASGAFMRAEDGRIAKRPFVPPGIGLRGTIKLADELRRVVFGDLAEQRARFPRLDLAKDEWAASFSSWCLTYGYENLLEQVRPWATAFGYGFMEDVPAAYILNYLCVFAPAFELHDTGYGGLWERVSRTLDVRVDTHVERVLRSNDGVRVETSRGAFEARDLVLACPLDKSLSFLDPSPEERALFSRIRTMDYQTVMLDTTGMPEPAYLFLPENMGKEAVGRPMFCYRRHRETGVVGFYSFAGRGKLDGAEEEARLLVERLGGRVKKVLARRSWHYFPHVGSNDFAARFYPKLEALQGQRHTYYAGEVLSFSCVEPVVAYAEVLADRIVRHGHMVQPRDLPFRAVENDTARARRAVNE